MPFNTCCGDIFDDARSRRYFSINRHTSVCGWQVPNLSLVTELMQRGSLFDILYKEKVKITISLMMKLAKDIAKGTQSHPHTLSMYALTQARTHAHVRTHMPTRPLGVNYP